MFGKLFQLIDRAKNLGSYHLANLAFAALVDKALDAEKELFFLWEKSWGNEEEIYYDLLVISDGLRSACIPAPLLKNPLAFRSLCRAEVEKPDHNRHGVLIARQDLKSELEKIRDEILELSPNVQVLARKYLDPVSGDCLVCPFFASGHNRGAIHCALHPLGYPSSDDEHLCLDWEVNLGLEEAQDFQAELRNIELNKLWEQVEGRRRKKEQDLRDIAYKKYLAEQERQKAEIEEICQSPFSCEVQKILDDWDNNESWKIIPGHLVGQEYPHCSKDICNTWVFRSSISSSCELSGQTEEELAQELRQYAKCEYYRLKNNSGESTAIGFLVMMFSL